jgi:hypothetical protein
MVKEFINMSNVKVKIDKNAGVIEVEGPETFVKEMIEKYSLSILTLEKKPDKPVKTPDSRSKTDGRGGVRSKVISPAIDKLIEEGWLNDFKNEDEIRAELKRLRVPGLTKVNVSMALGRRVPDKLDRIKGEGGTWTYKKK